MASNENIAFAVILATVVATMMWFMMGSETMETTRIVSSVLSWVVGFLSAAAVLSFLR